MDLDAVTFPALIVGDNGWVDLVETKAALSTSSVGAIRRFNKRRGVVLYDSTDHGWRVEAMIPLKRDNIVVRLLRDLFNSTVDVRVVVSQIADSPLQVTQDVLMAAIDADDDVLTQYTNASELKDAVRAANSFETLLAVLQNKRAI